MSLNKAQVVQLVLENDRAVERALIVLFNRQTAAERSSNTTNRFNDVGFTGADAHWGCRNAKQLLANKPLSSFQLAYWRKRDKRGTPRIAKYWAQLAVAAQAKKAGVPDPGSQRFTLAA